MMDSQAEVEALFSQRNNHSMLHNEIRAQLDTTFAPVAMSLFMKIDSFMEGEYYDSKNERIAKLKHTKVEDYIVAIIAAAIHTKNTQTIQQMVGYVANHLPHEDAFDRAVTAGELIALGHKPGGLYEVVRHGSGTPATIQVNHWDFLEANLLHMFSWINNTHFNLPLIEPPLEVTDNHSCGYHTIKEPCILGQFTMHEDKINLDTINQLNSIEWILDQDVLAEPEVPGKPITDPLVHQQFLDMAAHSRHVYNLLGCRPFWLAWQADSRGRYYSHGYHVNLQAQEYKKAMLNFNKWETLT
jgi:hypothetical protein